MEIRRVVVLGHSFSRRLQLFCRNAGLANLYLDSAAVEFLCQDPAGIKVSDVGQWRDQIVLLQPHLVIMFIGENDITDLTDPYRLAKEIIDMAESLVWSRDCTVIISQLMPRYYSPNYRYFVNNYNALAQDTNFFLCSLDWPLQVKCWSHDFICQAQGKSLNFKDASRFFGQDGVHLNDEGHGRLAKSLFKACLKFRF